MENRNTQFEGTYFSYLQDAGRDIQSVSPLMGRFISCFLYRLYCNEMQMPQIEVRSVYTLRNGIVGALAPGRPVFNKSLEMYHFDDSYVFFIITYHGEEYYVTIKTVLTSEFSSPHQLETTVIYTHAISTEALYTKEIIQNLEKAALRYSTLANKVIRYRDNTPYFDTLNNYELINPLEVSLSSLYLPRIKKEQISRFIETVKRPGELPSPSRILLNGKPGTGKTKTMQAIVSALHGSTTIIYCSSGNVDLKRVIEFSLHFENALLIIDDLDFSTTDRETGPDTTDLSKFLTLMDSVADAGLQIIAATSDKELIDAAAKRPGRFDMIIDLGEIAPENYRELISDHTAEIDIHELFSDEILRDFAKHKVTGAFIVNLVKQLRSVKILKGSVSAEEFQQLFRLVFQGFYGDNSKDALVSFGF